MLVMFLFLRYINRTFSEWGGNTRWHHLVVVFANSLLNGYINVSKRESVNFKKVFSLFLSHRISTRDQSLEKKIMYIRTSFVLLYSYFPCHTPVIIPSIGVYISTLTRIQIFKAKDIGLFHKYLNSRPIVFSCGLHRTKL